MNSPSQKGHVKNHLQENILTQKLTSSEIHRKMWQTLRDEWYNAFNFREATYASFEAHSHEAHHDLGRYSKGWLFRSAHPRPT